MQTKARYVRVGGEVTKPSSCEALNIAYSRPNSFSVSEKQYKSWLLITGGREYQDYHPPQIEHKRNLLQEMMKTYFYSGYSNRPRQLKKAAA